MLTKKEKSRTGRQFSNNHTEEVYRLFNLTLMELISDRFIHLLLTLFLANGVLLSMLNNTSNLNKMEDKMLHIDKITM